LRGGRPAYFAELLHSPSDYAAFAKRNRMDWAVVTTRTKTFTRTVQGVELRYVPTALYVYHRGIRAIEAVEATYW
jgi:hypothetical protein